MLSNPGGTGLRDTVTIQQRPYEAYLISGFWYLAGTLPHDMEGGTFELIMEARNGRVVELTHGK